MPPAGWALPIGSEPWLKSTFSESPSGLGTQDASSAQRRRSWSRDPERPEWRVIGADPMAAPGAKRLPGELGMPSTSGLHWTVGTRALPFLKALRAAG